MIVRFAPGILSSWSGFELRSVRNFEIDDSGRPACKSAGGTTDGIVEARRLEKIAVNTVAAAVEMTVRMEVATPTPVPIKRWSFRVTEREVRQIASTQPSANPPRQRRVITVL